MAGAPSHRRRACDRGQATVELVLVLPVVMLVLVGLVQLGVVARDQVLVWNAAREAGRQAAVSGDGTVIRQAALAAAPGLAPDRVVVTVSGGNATGDTITVTIQYRSARVVPLAPAEWLLTHEATASFRRE